LGHFADFDSTAYLLCSFASKHVKANKTAELHQQYGISHAPGVEYAVVIVFLL